MLVPTLSVAVCFVCITVVASGLNKPYYDLDDAENLFREFVKQQGKVYNQREYSERLEIFKKTLQSINMRNEKFPLTVFKVDRFADLKPEELELYRGFKPSNVTVEKVRIPVRPGDAPKEFDWRKQNVVTHVKDQGSCGSCYIFSAIGNIEGQYAIKHKQCLALSEGQAIDCLKAGGCDTGYMVDIMKEFSKKSGVMKEEDYSYTPAKGSCHEDVSKVAAKVKEGHVLDIPDEDTLAKNLVQIGPLAVALDDTDLQSYAGGILDPHFCRNNNFNHAVLLVGYGEALAAEDLDFYYKGILVPRDCIGQKHNHAVVIVGYGEENGTKFWILKNSWGADWGESGYLRLLRGVNACVMGTSYTASCTVA